LDNAIIELKGVSFSYNEKRQVLNNLDLSLCENERVAITGPNGSGKTTLFHLIVGLLKPQSGEIFAYGKNRNKESDFYEVRQKAGLLFQNADDQLFCATVAEDVAFGPLNLGKTHAEAREIVAATLDMLELSGYENKITYKLSGGEKRIVSLATILAMEPHTLLLDEPTTGLDDHFREKLINILKTLNKSMLVISHDKNFLSEVTDKNLRLSDGSISAN
jgi:cobalt/nickel transport system ATP-binding protein